MSCIHFCIIDDKSNSLFNKRPASGTEDDDDDDDCHDNNDKEDNYDNRITLVAVNGMLKWREQKCLSYSKPNPILEVFCFSLPVTLYSLIQKYI